jgi:RNA polymerase sigma-70 factor, ECF subfamily
MCAQKITQRIGNVMRNEPRFGAETHAPPAESDRHLVARVRLRDEAAFEQLFRRYYASVHQLLYRLLGDADQADDLVQETFLAFYSRPPRLQLDDEAIRPWLYRVALNRGYNALRSQRRAQAQLPRMFSPELEVDPEEEAVLAEECARVHATLARLPERQAQLLVLRQEEGLKYAEIAAILEIAPGSIGTLLVRAERAFQLAWNQTGKAPAATTPKGEVIP